MAGILSWIGRSVDELVNMGYPESVAKRISSGELPMDVDSINQRDNLLGLTSDVYHGAARFDKEFPLSDLDLGLHVGSPDQANFRLQDLAAGPFGTRSSFDYPDEARVFPLKANLSNQLVMPDAGDWKDSYQVLTALRKTPLYKKYQNRFLDLEDQINEFQMGMNSDILWRKTPENRAILDELRQVIQDEGYDTIKYANAVENQYGSLSGYTPEAEALRTQIADEISRIEGSANDKRMALLPEDSSSPDAKEAVQRFLASELEDFMSIEDLARIDSLKAESRRIADDPASKLDPNSYIILDPDKNAKSRFAASDPEYTGSNILGSRMAPTAVAGLLGASALAGSDKAMANPVGDLRTSEAQWDMTPEERAIADLRASEASFGNQDQDLADAYTGASTLWDNVGTSLKNAGVPAGLVDIMQPSYESSAAKASGDDSAMTGLFAMLEKLDPVAYAGLLGSEYLKRKK